MNTPVSRSIHAAMQEAMAAVFDSRHSRYYMPAMLLAALEYVRGGGDEAWVPRLETCERFERILSAANLPGVERAFEPFYHLSVSADAWTLYGPDRSPASFEKGRPKSPGVLEHHVAGARFTRRIADATRDRDAVARIMRVVRGCLLIDGDPGARALGRSYRLPMDAALPPEADEARADVLDAISGWNTLLLSTKVDEPAMMAGAHVFVSDADLSEWAPAHRVAVAGDQARDDELARRTLVDLGFVDVTGDSIPATAPVRRVARETFAEWIAVLAPRAAAHAPRPDDATVRLLVSPEAGDAVMHRAGLDAARAEEDEGFIEGNRQASTGDVPIRSRSLLRLARLCFAPRCVVCGFDFGTEYGNHGEGYIELHHRRALRDGVRVSRVEDLGAVCANCHRMLHRGSYTLSIEDLQDRRAEARGGGTINAADVPSH